MTPPSHNFLAPRSNKPLLLLYCALSTAYFAVVAWVLPSGNVWLFAALLVGEVFHLWQALTYAHTVWELQQPPEPPAYTPAVDIYITVVNEPLAIVERTARAALDQAYPNHRVYLLNDGRVAGNPAWRAYEEAARQLGISCITRTVPGGAKAGNINHALTQTSGEIVAVLDVDHVPHRTFLKKTAGYFADPAVAFVQSPQYYKNAGTNAITGAAWEQQALFFGSICIGKNRLGGVTMCGTNMLIRRSALEAVGGVDQTSIVEDFLTGMRLHAKGYRSVYVPAVLAEGLAPEDLRSYYTQQFRWARGSLEVLFRYNPLFMRGLSWQLKLQYIAAASYFLSGPIVALNALLPVAYLLTGATPLVVSTMLLATVFLPFILLTVYVLGSTSNGTFTFRAVAFSMSAFPIHLQALLATLLRRKNGFHVTSKTKLSGSFWRLALPHLSYLALAAGSVGVALHREGISAALVSNLGWVIFMAALFMPYIHAAVLPATSEADTPALPATTPANVYAK